MSFGTRRLIRLELLLRKARERQKNMPLLWSAIAKLWRESRTLAFSR